MHIDFNDLDRLKDKLNGFRPLPPEILRNLHEVLVLQWTYHSNAIEGNTLTLKETKVALEGVTIGGKTLREHFEVINHRDAIVFVEELVQQQVPLSDWVIKQIHQLVLKNVDDQYAGRYRHLNVLIAGAAHRPPDALQIVTQMQTFIEAYQTTAQALHPVARAAWVHAEFVKIHPFVDGNGRTSRLLMNLELMKAGFPAAVLPVERRLAYYEALDTAHCEGDLEPFVQLVATCVAQSFEPYWWALAIKQVD